jgi:hypothetical protein
MLESIECSVSLNIPGRRTPVQQSFNERHINGRHPQCPSHLSLSFREVKEGKQDRLEIGFSLFFFLNSSPSKSTKKRKEKKNGAFKMRERGEDYAKEK